MTQSTDNIGDGADQPDRSRPEQARDAGSEWFANGEGLAFQCTLCGNCCTGPEGYVLVNEREAAALAKRFGISVPEFKQQYTRETLKGPSLNEKLSPAGYDCVFLDREKIPGKAVCGVYEDRPAQCRTWPFWKSNLNTRWAWERAKRTCPGMDKGKTYSVQQIRVLRDVIEI